MFDKKDIAICKGLKNQQTHRNGVIQAVRNKDNSLSFVFKKRIQGTKRNPLGLLIAKYPSGTDVNLKHINETALNWTHMCEEGKHPKEFNAYQKELEEQHDKIEKKLLEDKERTFGWVFNKYNERKKDNGQNTESTLKDRIKSINLNKL